MGRSLSRPWKAMRTLEAACPGIWKDFAGEELTGHRRFFTPKGLYLARRDQGGERRRDPGAAEYP